MSNQLAWTGGNSSPCKPRGTARAVEKASCIHLGVNYHDHAAPLPALLGSSHARPSRRKVNAWKVTPIWAVLCVTLHMVCDLLCILHLRQYLTANKLQQSINRLLLNITYNQQSIVARSWIFIYFDSIIFVPRSITYIFVDICDMVVVGGMTRTLEVFKQKNLRQSNLDDYYYWEPALCWLFLTRGFRIQSWFDPFFYYHPFSGVFLMTIFQWPVRWRFHPVVSIVAAV